MKSSSITRTQLIVIPLKINKSETKHKYLRRKNDGNGDKKQSVYDPLKLQIKHDSETCVRVCVQKQLNITCNQRNECVCTPFTDPVCFESHHITYIKSDHSLT